MANGYAEQATAIWQSNTPPDTPPRVIADCTANLNDALDRISKSIQRIATSNDRLVGSIPRCDAEGVAEIPASDLGALNVAIHRAQYLGGLLMDEADRLDRI